MKKKYMFATLPILLGVLCFIIFSFIGSYVAEDGTLVEPFFLVPIGYLLFFAGIISLLIIGVQTMMKKFRPRN
ncbi:DUF3955 domain-containing protein [Paenibacillus aquistagni]|uniref:DUF3955 domain-containing protein n=1 Tax=Paenibacillus aquistagni TaxID=1852522 RepID=A0A1X7J354_9BACL|nr:DUF3955 domain-containing protein [Paenibacillus aquistagni]SMG21693.1 Protein of unknown function [Paenibacillus aquistagni]